MLNKVKHLKKDFSLRAKNDRNLVCVMVELEGFEPSSGDGIAKSSTCL